MNNKDIKKGWGIRGMAFSLRCAAVGAVVCAAGLWNAFAVVSELPVTTVRGEKCYYYDVQPKESIYQVANKLGVTREQITEHNPSAADGLKPRMRLYFPVSDFEQAPGTRKAVYAAAAGVNTHVVKKGETIYGIARKYGMSPDYLAQLNPQVADGLKTGDVLRITDECDDAQTAAAGAADADGYVRYEIKPGDTLFSVSNSYGVPLEAVLEANPALDPLHYGAGQVIRIPVGATASKPEPEATQPLVAENPVADHYAGVAVNESPSTPADAILTAREDEVNDADGVEEREVMNVAVMLPFMLEEETQSRTTQLYTEFFKGLLMAADTLRNEPGAQVNFRFFDTAASLDTVQAILGSDRMKDVDLVIAPDNTSHLAAIVDAADPETLVLNIFAVKDEEYKNHRNMIQTNIPHDAMYGRAIDAFMKKYAGVLPVFLHRNAGLADKDPFVRMLKERLTQEGRDYRELTFDSSLSDADLAEFDPDLTPMVFVPVSGSKTEFARFVKAITALRERASDSGRVTMFGYPEWITFRDESFDELCALDATIYSRFLATDSQPALNRLRARYKELYGTDMFEAVPTQGVLGYDTGVFVINGLREKAATGVFPSEFDGVQSCLKLGWSGATSVDAATGELMSNGGLVNEALYIINYRPGGTVEWEK